MLDAATWIHAPALRWTLTILYLAVLGMICLYGSHRYYLVWLYYRNRGRQARVRQRFASLPRITVQLPMYNEAEVACRIIDAACRLDYPTAKLQIQVLDDSTDGSDQICAERVAYWQQKGLNIELIHRQDRGGFKAGALANAMAQCSGEFIAIFDADFVPPPHFLRRAIHHFTDPQVGMVQARWDHINRDNSLLTRCQAIFLDGHFVIEHTARNTSQRWINFNGTAGLWRRQAIDSAGGWHHDTLTEDVDLSYRAQLAGWKFLYLPRLGCPAELPPEINAFKSQQHRWTKGSIQTARKLLPNLLRSPAPLAVKTEAFFHLTAPMVYLYVTLMVLLFFPVLLTNAYAFEGGSVPSFLLGSSLFALGTFSAGTFYIASQRARKRPLLQTIAQLPALMAIGVGVALNNARGCVEALVGHQSEFVRTPKYNINRNVARRQAAMVIPTPSIKLWMSLLEVLMGLYVLACSWLSLTHGGGLISLPFLLLFALGYLYVGVSSLHLQYLSRRGAIQMAPVAS